jgi:hypothetical protein
MGYTYSQRVELYLASDCAFGDCRDPTDELGAHWTYAPGEFVSQRYRCNSAIITWFQSLSQHALLVVFACNTASVHLNHSSRPAPGNRHELHCTCNSLQSESSLHDLTKVTMW